MQKPPVPQFLLLSNSITESSWAAPSESEGVQEGPGTEAIGFYFAFFGCKICFQRSWAFFIHPDPLPVSHTNELVELGHAQAEAATGKSESVPELQQSRAACWAPCWCPGLAPGQSCHANPPQGQARPACVGRNPGCAGCGCSFGLAGECWMGHTLHPWFSICSAGQCPAWATAFLSQSLPTSASHPVPSYPVGSWQGMLVVPAWQEEQWGCGG